jgi:hypothetical protein
LCRGCFGCCDIVFVFFFSGVGRVRVGVGRAGELLEGEADGGGVEGALGGGFVAVDGEGDVVGRVLVFILRIVSIRCPGALRTLAASFSEGAPTRRYLKVLISPKRCNTRKISRLSDRFAGRGRMRK